MEIIDGRKLAKEIQNQIKSEVARLPFQPVFCDVLAGDDPASAQYVRMKAKAAERVGFKFRQADYPASITAAGLAEEIKKIGSEPNMCGLIVQLPLPASMEKQTVLNAIDPSIDVDCIGRVNSEKFYSGRPYMVFPTAAAVMALLDSVNMDLQNKSIVIVGQGELVGRPVKTLLEARGLKPEIVRRSTEKPEEILKAADVIISAVGKPKLINGNNIREGVVIIDAGTAESDGGIAGDVDLESVRGKAAFLSPVPGGVGPVTVAKLLENVLKVAKNKI
ncbi:MAG: bifunctional 5,10-methylenetetrahydrofolate dehydrogenase/5,10-methenyltetrahydrofolate cyclohydrolase [Patescibacteria group bacterium]|nr:bifunctional 5,10-methylenetetrahydrofolate dehydrogenase/5,10-methenyltetrahydrofolate cyclohydrolase [Patescibacteria group bacterium]